MNLLKRALLVATTIVAASTLVLPSITGYGTILFQIVALGGWGLVAAVTSGGFADQHHFIVWPIAGLINVLLFSIPVGIAYKFLRNFSPKAGVAVIVLWSLFYLGCLFFLFPATDGP